MLVVCPLEGVNMSARRLACFCALCLVLLCSGCFVSKTALITRSTSHELPVRTGTYYGAMGKDTEKSSVFAISAWPAENDPHRYRYADIPGPDQPLKWLELRVRRVEGDVYLAQLRTVDGEDVTYFYQYFKKSRTGAVLLNANEETKRVVAGSVGVGLTDSDGLTASASDGWRFAAQVGQLEAPGNWKAFLAKDSPEGRFRLVR
jgi:hypothetical protein